jgi:hypothetical protein
MHARGADAVPVEGNKGLGEMRHSNAALADYEKEILRLTGQDSLEAALTSTRA